MGLKDVILQKALRKVDDTIGKKFKIIDDVTDLFQGTEGRINDLEDSNKIMQEEINELKTTVKSLERYVQEISKGVC
jgi:uncharacterized protein YoxC